MAAWNPLTSEQRTASATLRPRTEPDWGPIRTVRDRLWWWGITAATVVGVVLLAVLEEPVRSLAWVLVYGALLALMMRVLVRLLGGPPAPGTGPRLRRVAVSPPPTVQAAEAVHCPYCQSGIAAGDEHVVCAACAMPHHPDCWRENGGCTTYGCERGPVG